MKKFLTLVCCALLTACGDDIPPDILNAPRAVTTPTPDALEQTTWPRLGDVPSKPKDIPSPAVIQQNIKDMENLTKGK